MGGLVFPELRRWFSFRTYERELNEVVSRADREIARIDLAYLTDATSVAERAARDAAEQGAGSRARAAESAAEREG